MHFAKLISVSHSMMPSVKELINRISATIRHDVLILQMLLTFVASHGCNPDRNVISGHNGICICKWLELIYEILWPARMKICAITVMHFRVHAIKLAVDNRESNKFRQTSR